MIKQNTKSFFCIAFIVLIVASFLAGSHMKEQEYSTGRMQRCNTLISFAIDKAGNEGISDPDTMEALISNIYAAYQFCDSPNLAEQLHDLWNKLIFEGNSYIGKEDVLLNQLRNISEAMKMGH